MKFSIEWPGADERPQRMHPRFVRRDGVEYQLLQQRPCVRAVSLGQQPLGRLAVINVWAFQAVDKLSVGLAAEIDFARVRRAFVTDAIEPPVAAIDAGRVAL